MTYWDRFGRKREAFDNIIGKEPRLKKTPFAFGGAMVIHRNLMRIVPFDPEITRGEDTDYVMNSRIFGFNFYLDNTLSIKHLPPPKSHPVWKRFREDIYRFLYGKSKFDNQVEKINLHYINPEDFDPYPGQFMKPDLGDKIFKTNIILALDYLANNEIEACKETVQNIYLARYDAIPHTDTYQKYLDFQNNWRKVLEHTKDMGNTLKDIIKSGLIIKHDKYLEEKNKFLRESGIDKNVHFEKVVLFREFTRKEIRQLFFISEIIHMEKDEYVFKCGEQNKCIYIILQGNLKVKKIHSITGDEIIVSELHQGDHFNETSIFFDEPHSVSIQATTPIELLVIKNDRLKEILFQNNELSTKILWMISRKLSERLIQTT
ncbi:MAG: cyclic nucleotide-binding domain-containing protein [Candidatus Cloacimonetes bacterium]|nr:cyclic nucleotide-binding domain-containing protein [Candidatus Cloacimonadota bacterium]